MQARQPALWAAATTGMLVGAAMVSTSTLSPAASSASLAFLRYAIGLAILAGPALLATWPRYRARDALAIALLGVLQFAVLILLLNHALARLPASTCALVFATMPLFTWCLAALSGREAFSTRRLAGLLLAVGGVAVLLVGSASPAGGLGGLAILGGSGMAALLAATVVGAATSILYGPYMRRYPALPTSCLAMAASVLFLALYGALQSQSLLPVFSATQWGHMVFIGLSSGLGYFCLLWALGRLQASQVIAFQALGPVTAALLELALHQRMPTPALLAAMALVLAGLVISTQAATH
ncbi:DMT family transporter [Comamonas piscis]|uniref:DMT family transporter n=1 Tax=Comamonas piscis TaxID=1562974 RepID=A0A7G5EEY4_9BURK|nr:DMT family transporter [Comamonas piscis]QMV72559.1 DMT family transporter [Comamonas piscis]WSO35329.1 DMT family transporter [Comamonas piscis]